MSVHLSKGELEAGLPAILDSPKDRGRLEAIVVRPESGERLDLAHVGVSLAHGTHGDRWAKGRSTTTADGKPDPDMQICIMNARAIALIAGDRARWPLAGDNLFIDMDLSPENLRPGQRLAIGTAVIAITDTAHNGCDSFVRRFGRDATVFVNNRRGKQHRLRGIYARVVQDGHISVGDVVKKCA